MAAKPLTQIIFVLFRKENHFLTGSGFPDYQVL
jgi:hypothetical protein